MAGIKEILARQMRLIAVVVILGSLLFFIGKLFEDGFIARTRFSASTAGMQTLLKDREDLSSITTDELMKMSGITQYNLLCRDRRFETDQILIAIFSAIRTAGFIILILGYPFCLVFEVFAGRLKASKVNRR